VRLPRLTLLLLPRLRLPLLLLALFAAHPEIKAVFLTAAAFTTAKFLADIKDKAGRLFGSSPAPPSISK